MAAIGQECEGRHTPALDMSYAGWLQSPRSGSFRLGRSTSTRVSSFGRDVVIPALKRQGSAIASTSISLYREGLTMSHSSCFGSWRWTTPGAESPRSNLLRNTDHIAAAEDFTSREARLPGGAPVSGGFVLNEAPRDGVFFGEPKSSSSLSSRSMSFMQSNSSGAQSAGTTTQWSMESRRESQAAQWTAGRAGPEIETERFKPAPMWKQWLKKLRAKAKRHVHPVPAREWTNYDAQSYAKNFDNGGRHNDSNIFCSSYLDEEDEKLQLGLRKTALHTALLQKFHSTRYDSSADTCIGRRTEEDLYRNEISS